MEARFTLKLQSDGRFSEELKEALDDRALSILRVERFSPDITGFLQKKDSSYRELITVEIKPDKIKIKHISRAKLYADVLNARYGILISPKRIPEEIRRFVKDRSAITYRLGGSFTIAQYNKATSEFKFDKKLYSTIPEPFKSTS